MIVKEAEKALFSLICLILITSWSCNSYYIVRPDYTLTPEKAKRIILEFERSQVRGVGNLTKDSIEVTDDYFCDFYTVKSVYDYRVRAGTMETEIKYWYGLRKINFTDVESIQMRFGPYAFVISALTLGIVGPSVAYELWLTPRSGADIARNRDIDAQDLLMAYCSHWKCLFPLWLFFPKGGSQHSEGYRFGQAILHMVEQTKLKE